MKKVMFLFFLCVVMGFWIINLIFAESEGLAIGDPEILQDGATIVLVYGDNIKKFSFLIKITNGGPGLALNAEPGEGVDFEEPIAQKDKSILISGTNNPTKGSTILKIIFKDFIGEIKITLKKIGVNDENFTDVQKDIQIRAKPESEVNSAEKEEGPEEILEMQDQIDGQYNKNLAQMSLPELEAEEERLQEKLDNLSGENSALLTIYSHRDELKEKKGEKTEIKNSSSPYRQTVKLKAETERGERYLQSLRVQKYLRQKQLSQEQEKERLSRQIAELKPPRKKFISISAGIFGNASSSDEYSNNYYSKEYGDDDDASSSGYFLEGCVKFPIIGKLEGAIFGAWTSAGQGWYLGSEGRLILTDDGYRILISIGGILLNNAVAPRIGLIIDSNEWMFFASGLPGAKNNVQVGLGYKL